MDDTEHLINIKKHVTQSDEITVRLPNKATMRSTHTAELNIKGLSPSARLVHLFPNLQGSLLAFGPLCDDGCIIHLDKSTVHVFKNGVLLLSGFRDGPGKLWLMDLGSSQPLIDSSTLVESSVNAVSHSAHLSISTPDTSLSFLSHSDTFSTPSAINNVNQMPDIISSSIERVLCFYHGAFGSLPISTFRKAIQKKFISFPGITVEHVTKYLRHSMYTDKGHMKRLRQGMDSTKQNQFYDCNDVLPTISVDKHRKFKILIHLIPSTRRIHLDGTGKFVYPDGTYDYDLIFFCEDSNYIHGEKMKGITKTEYVTAISDGLAFYTNKGMQYEISRLDNQTSDLVVHLLKVTNQMTIEAVPPDSHRGLKAERAIQTWKNHKISILATADESCPGGAFKHVNHHVEMTLNLVRQSGISPHMSAWHQLHGAWSYTDNPIAPFGMKVEVFRSKNQRATTWDVHSQSGFYVGLPRDHHRCHQVYLPKTRSVVISDTLSWYPKKHFLLPGTSTTDDLVAAIDALCQAITNVTPVNNQPNHSVIVQLQQGLQQFKNLFQRTSEKYPNFIDLPVAPITEIFPVQNTGAMATRSTARNSSALSNNVLHINPTLTNILTTQDLRKPKIIGHKGKFCSIKNPLHFLLQVNNANNKSTSSWVLYDDIKSFSYVHDYIESIPSLWKVYQNGLKFSESNDEPPPWYQIKHISNPVSNSINKILQHRQNKDFIHYFDIHFLPKGQSSPIWLKLNGSSDRLTTEPAFQRYLFTCKDIKFKKYFASSTFESKFHFANIAEQTKPISDHHGLKYLDKGKALRYFKAIKGDEKQFWINAHSDELDRLINRRKSMRFIKRSDKEKGRVESYWNPQLTKKSKNGEIIYRVRGCVGGNINDFYGNSTAYTASLPTVKLLFNAIVSEPDAKLMTLDLKDFFLHGSSGRNEYMRIPLSYFTDDDMIKYDIKSFIKEGDTSVLVEIHGNMYGLVNAAIVAQEGLVKLLNANDFYETNTPQLYKHKTRNIQFTLVVDDFAVKYTNKTDADLLISVLEKQFDVSIDWDGKLYLGMAINLDRSNPNPRNHTLSLSMNGYIARLLERLNLGPYKSNVNSPMVYAAPKYGQKIQYTNVDESDFITEDKIRFLQQGIGGFLYYCRAVGYDYYTTVSKLSSRQAKPTEQVWKEYIHLLNYANTWPNSTLVFKASDMILVLDADVSYLSESHSRSRGGGIAFCGRKDEPDFINGAIDVLSIILPTVVSSTCEGEYATAFVMAQLGMSLRVNLRDMGYPQDRTLLTTDNQCAEGIANKTMKLKRSRSMDMRYHWLQDRVKQGDYSVTWRRNTKSLADFFTKTLPTKEFLERRSLYVVKGLPTLLPNLSNKINK